jgi:hypothetical protein
MISGVPVIAAISSHDASCAAMVQAGRRHGIFTVVIARLYRQQTLAIAEPDTIPAEWKGTATLDEL